MSEATPPPASTVARFPCGGCGADLHYDPAADALKCPFCGMTTPVDAAGDVVELDLRAALEQAVTRHTGDRHHEHACTSCGATLRTEPNVTSDRCPFCGTVFVAEATEINAISPGAVLPFDVPRPTAVAAYTAWLARLWFAPGNLKKQADLDERLVGVYLPYWTFDIDVTTAYTGQRGEHYWDTESYTTTINGRSVRQTRRVRKTRWWPAWGVVRNQFDDALIPAAATLPKDKLDALEPWDLAALQPYDERFLAGFRAESATVPLDQGFDLAVRRVRPAIEASIRRDIGGDEQRIASQRDTFHGLTFKHLLMPAWIAVYRYKDKPYRVLINARTGEVKGDRPWSAGKIALAVLAGLILIGIIAAVVAATGSTP